MTGIIASFQLRYALFREDDRQMNRNLILRDSSFFILLQPNADYVHADDSLTASEIIRSRRVTSGYLVGAVNLTRTLSSSSWLLSALPGSE